MDTSRSAVERIRPILQAMERSIDSARRQRTQSPGISGTALSRPSATASAQGLTQATVGQAIPQPQPAAALAASSATGRLKAKPKRLGTFASPYEQPVYRSQTG